MRSEHEVGSREWWAEADRRQRRVNRRWIVAAIVLWVLLGILCVTVIPTLYPRSSDRQSFMWRCVAARGMSHEADCAADFPAAEAAWPRWGRE